MSTSKLTALGFTESQASVYLMLHRMGLSPASSVAKRSHFKRVTVYSILSTLEKAGMVCTKRSKKGKYYLARDPSCLLGIIHEEELRLQAKKKIARECIDEIRSSSLTRSSMSNSSTHIGEVACFKILSMHLGKDSPLKVYAKDLSSRALPTQTLRKYLKKYPQIQRFVTAHSTKGTFSELRGELPKLGLLVDFETNDKNSSCLIMEENQVFLLTESGGQVELTHMVGGSYVDFFKVAFK